MDPHDSFSWEQSLNKTDIYQQRTAARSPKNTSQVRQTSEYTPASNRMSQKSSSRKVHTGSAAGSTRFAGVKSAIDSCIESMSIKRDMNRDALVEVRDVNRELLENVSASFEVGRNLRNMGESYIPEYKSERRPSWHYDKNGERENVTPSTFQLQNTSDYYVHPHPFQHSEVFRPGSIGLGQEAEIRQQLANERALNQSLQRQIQHLRMEQSSQDVPGQSQALGALEQENARLLRQLQNMDSVSGIQGIYAEFKELKEDNQRLRIETVQLLKRGGSKTVGQQY